MTQFRRPSVSYGRTAQPATPHQKAAQVWDDRIGSARVQARNWWLAAFGNLILAAGLAVGLVRQAARGTVIPWLVQVDKLGQAQAVSAAAADYHPTDPQIAWHLARFIERVGSIPADAVIVRQNWITAYDFVTEGDTESGAGAAKRVHILVKPTRLDILNQSRHQQQSGEERTMNIRFGALVFPNVQQLDLTGPYEMFALAPGAEMHLIWKERNPVLSSSKLWLTPTTTFEDCPPLDVLCIPGGGGVNALLEDDAVLRFVRGQAAVARYVSSVCTGALVLGAAGLLRGRRATTHWNAHHTLAAFGAIPVEGRIVRDGNVITAGGVTAGIDFGLSLIAELLGQSEAETIQLVVEYAPEPPYRAGTPREAPAEILEAARNRLQPLQAAREEILARLKAASATPSLE